MIRIKNLTKNYGPVKAVDAVSFDVNKGEILGFLGPNGAGKTTTLKMITGVLRPTSGTVEIFGNDILEDPVQARSSFGYLPENNPLYPDLNPVQYLSFIARMRNVEDVPAELARVMKMVFITDMAERPIGKLSKGYRQRVGLAAALIGSPAILFLDEPTVGLDPNQIVEIRNLIREIGKTTTIVLSTHILQEVSSTCDRVVIINQGRLVAIDSQEGLRRRVEGQNRVTLLQKGASDDLIGSLKEIDGVVKVETGSKPDGIQSVQVFVHPQSDIRAQAARMVMQSGGELLELLQDRLSLEEVFLKLTTTEGDPE